MVLSNRTYARAEKSDKAFSPFPKGLVDVYKVNVGDREGALGYETRGLVELTDSLQERYTFRTEIVWETISELKVLRCSTYSQLTRKVLGWNSLGDCSRRLPAILLEIATTYTEAVSFKP